MNQTTTIQRKVKTIDSIMETMKVVFCTTPHSSATFFFSPIVLTNIIGTLSIYSCCTLAYGWANAFSGKFENNRRLGCKPHILVRWAHSIDNDNIEEHNHACAYFSPLPVGTPYYKTWQDGTRRNASWNLCVLSHNKSKRCNQVGVQSSEPFDKLRCNS